MPSKSIFLSVTFWGAALSGLLALVDHLTGVKLNDQVGPLESAITEFVQALLAALPSFSLPLAHLAAVLTIITGRFLAKQPVHFVAPKGAPSFPGALSCLAATAVLACASGLTGCGTTTGALPSPGLTPSGIISAAPSQGTATATNSPAIVQVGL